MLCSESLPLETPESTVIYHTANELFADSTADALEKALLAPTRLSCSFASTEYALLDFGDEIFGVGQVLGLVLYWHILSDP